VTDWPSCFPISAIVLTGADIVGFRNFVIG
jgi:hypothetical protein